MKKIIAILLVIVIICVCFAGCGATAQEPIDTRFKIIEEEYVGPNSMVSRQAIVVDTETNVMYLFAYGRDYASGLTVLLDADGKPLLWEG